ncbi:MAG TPA: hypothetical protein VNE41_01090 [Chitinophagaceae bacterium]|nr:hypothetical protein [Chitinophagaceae bacterium]
MENINQSSKKDFKRNKKHQIRGKDVLLVFDIEVIQGRYLQGINIEKIIADNKANFPLNSLIELNEKELNDLEAQLIKERIEPFGESSDSFYGQIMKREFVDPLRKFPYVLTAKGEAHLKSLIETGKNKRATATGEWFNKVHPVYKIDIYTKTERELVKLIKEWEGSEFSKHPEVIKMIDDAQDRIRSIKLHEAIDGNQTFLSNYKQSENEVDPFGLIDNVKKELLLLFEKNIIDKVEIWKKGKDKTGCAVFCLLLYDKSFFKNGPLANIKKFAAGRYKIDIYSMVDKLQKGRESEWLKLEKEKMDRLIQNRKYGLIQT